MFLLVFSFLSTFSPAKAFASQVEGEGMDKKFEGSSADEATTPGPHSSTR